MRMAVTAEEPLAQPSPTQQSQIEILTDDLLISVLDYVGDGHFAFVANVSTRFHVAYKRYEEQRKPSPPLSPYPFNTSAESILESVDRVAFAWSEGLTRDEDHSLKALLHTAAVQGNLPTLQWLMVPDRCGTDALYKQDICIHAARNGHIHVLQWARSSDHWSKDQHLALCECAVEHGHIHVLEWARESKWLSGSGLGFCAVMYGQMDVLQWLTAHQCL